MGQNKMIYEPQEDSFLLQKYVKKYAKDKVLDMGSGSGIQAEAALTKTKDVLAADIDEESLNLLKNKCIKCIKSDLFSNISGKFDLIIFNPPYLPDEESEDMKIKNVTTGGKIGYELLIKFLKQAKTHLKVGGKILIVFSSLTNKNKINTNLKSLKYKFKCLEIKKLFFEELYVYLIENE